MSAPERVVSLLPAATEIICALGARSRLVGRSHECDVPDGVESLPVCSRTRIDLDAAGAVINGQVEDVLRHGLSVFEVLAEPLQELSPDLVVTQIQCEVCAVSANDVERALTTWTGSQPQLVSLEPNALRDVLADIQLVADALEIPEQGQRLRNEMRTRMRDIDGIANGVPGAPSVICVEWIEPLMAAGNWVPELVDLAGGDDRLAKAGVHSPWIEWQQIVDEDPDILVVMPCGFDLERTSKEAASLTELPGYDDLTAVRDGQVFAVDGHRYFNRPGPRLVESVEILAEIFHPDRFDFGHESKGWKRL